MKQLMIVFMMMLTMSITVMGQTSSQKASEVKKEAAKTVVVVSSASADSASTDSLANKDEDVFKSLKGEESGNRHFGIALDGDESIVSIIAIIAVFGMPVLIVLIVSIVNHKNKRAQYRLAEKALENGKDIPEGLFTKTKEETNLRAKGIKNIFLGIGLGIFLWAITGEFGLGCIGFMIMFIGLGQWIIASTGKKEENNNPFIRIHNDEKTGESSIKVGGIEIANKEKTPSEDKQEKE